MQETRIRAESLADQVYQFLELEIVEGRLAPGERIRESELSRQLGISRTPIREALLQLEMAGVVVCKSRRSYNVGVLSLEGLREIYEILGILEAPAASAVVGELTEEDFSQLEYFNLRMEETIDTCDFHVFGAWNDKFHRIFLGKFRNRSLRELCASVRRRIYIFPVHRASLPSRIGQAIVEHKEIIRLAKDKKAVELGAYLKDVHWNMDVHIPFLADAFSSNGMAQNISGKGETNAPGKEEDS